MKTANTHSQEYNFTAQYYEYVALIRENYHEPFLIPLPEVQAPKLFHTSFLNKKRFEVE